MVSEGDPSGRVSLLQQSFPRPRVKDILSANLLANDAIKNPVGVKIMPIPIDKLRVSVVTDASWGNAQEPQAKENPDSDYWVETSHHWIRHHCRPRRSLYHPGMSDHGPDLHQLSGERIALKKYENDKSEQEFKDEWNTAGSVKVDTLSWYGQTVFPKGQLSHNQIHEGFLQNQRLNSQGGHLLFYHDADLQYEPSASITLASWKSYKLKLKGSEHSSSRMSVIGRRHWKRSLAPLSTSRSSTSLDRQPGLGQAAV